MFSTACERGAMFTKHLLVVKAFADNRATCAVGTVTHINADGWALTANHIIADYLQSMKDMAAWQAHELAETKIAADPVLDDKEKGRATRRLKPPDKKLPRRVLLAEDGAATTFSTIYQFPAIDLAVVRIANFNANTVPGFPTFFSGKGRSPVGVSLCKLGFPFPEVALTYNRAKDSFDLGAGTQIPLFPLEGILTRWVQVNIPPGTTDPDAGGFTFPKRMIESSTPGLMGQSGGPWLDTRGRLWGIQSQTRSIPLGFDVKIPNTKPPQQLHQFVHLGWAASTDAILPILATLQVSVAVDDTWP